MANTSPAELFDELLPAAIAENVDAARRTGGVYAFKLTGEGGGEWTLDLTSSQPSVRRGLPGRADVRMEASSKNFLRMTENPSLGAQLFLQGKLRVTGDPDMAARLGALFSMAEEQRPQLYFRKGLLDAYGRRCVVSGDGAERALEAAHIIPRAEDGSNEVSNGLLLRADLHRLFDNRQMAIDPDTLTVVFDQDVLHPGSTYALLDRRQLRAPAKDEHRPRQDALLVRWSRCTWAQRG